MEPEEASQDLLDGNRNKKVPGNEASEKTKERGGVEERGEGAGNTEEQDDEDKNREKNEL